MRSRTWQTHSRPAEIGYLQPRTRGHQCASVPYSWSGASSSALTRLPRRIPCKLRRGSNRRTGWGIGGRRTDQKRETLNPFYQELTDCG